MKCPVCKTKSLVNNELEKGLQTLKCEDCGGQWIKSFQYWKWFEKHGDILPEKPESEAAELPVEESKEIKICPECGHFLTRRKVGHGISFRIDRCATCGGIWLDKNEWEILKSRNLHDEIHLVFGAAWQDGIVKEDIQKGIEEKFKEIFGEGDYAKLKEIKSWIDSHPKRNSIIGFLAG